MSNLCENKSEILTLSNISQWTHEEQDWNFWFDFPFKNKNVNFDLLENNNKVELLLFHAYEFFNVITLVLSGTSSMASNFDFSSITTCLAWPQRGNFKEKGELPVDFCSKVNYRKEYLIDLTSTLTCHK